MRKLSIKFRVTLWYTIFILLNALLFFLFLFIGSKELLVADTKKTLINAIQKGIEEIEYDDNTLDIDDDLEFYENNVYLSLYDKNFNLIYGIVPEHFKITYRFQNHVFQTYKNSQDEYYIYDYLIPFTENDDIWIRGILCATGSFSMTNIMLKTSVIILPILVLLAILGGYIITKRAFLPITQINETVTMISKNGDFSKRIRLNTGDDEIYQLAQTFDQMLDRLEQSYEAEKQFTNDASHELRTPISVIISQSEYGLQNAETLPDAQESFEVILRQARKMSSLVSRLLTLSRADNGTAKLQLELVNISELTEIIILEEELLCRKKNITITSSIEPNIKLYADQTLMTRLFINLISNAIQYGKLNGMIDIKLTQNEDNMICSITDNGIGISPEHIHKIWDRFYQVDTSRTSADESGSGLGLSMVKWIIESHGGTIQVKSTLGSGTCFIFQLPLHKKK